MDEIEFNSFQEQSLKDAQHYRKVLGYLELDMPTTCLCLPKPIENILIGEGFTRVYDLTSNDLTKIKGLGKARLDQISTRLFYIFSICI